MKKSLLALALIAAAGAAQASTVTQSAALNLEVTEISQAFDIAKFNASLGTLTSVQITLDGEAVSAASFINNASGPQNFSFASTLSLFLTGAGLSEQMDLSLFNYPRTLTALGTTNLGSVDKTDSLVVNATDLSAFIGTGKNTFTCESGVSNTQNGGGGNIVVRQDTQAGCGIQVVYTYDAPVAPPVTVPEPASMALVGLGMMGMAAIRRRASK